MSIACIAVLNVNDGDTQINFDPANPAEAEAARVAIASLLRAGHLVFALQPGGKTANRIEAFDPASGCYIVAGKEIAPVRADEVELIHKPKPRRGRPPKHKIPAAGAQVVSVGRSAGGWAPPPMAHRIAAARAERAGAQ